MFPSRLLITAFLLCFAAYGFGIEPFFSTKETLFSTKNGKAIGEVLFSITPKNATPTNNEWLLIIGSPTGKIVEARTETTLWIFNHKTNAIQFKKDLKNQDYPVEVKGLTELMPFCENGIRFVLKDWDELRKQTQLSFFINASPGEKVTLRLVCYTATSDKKRITIDDEAKVKIEFEVPTFSTSGKQVRQAGAGGVQGGETILQTEKITPEDAAAAAKLRELQREDSLSQAEAANRVLRLALLQTFISERNREIMLLQEAVNALLDDKTAKTSDSTIDSLSAMADEMKNRVDYWENGYADILLTEEALHDKFSKFRVAHTLTAKKIAELRQQQNPLYGFLDFVKNNLLLSFGGFIGGVIVLKCVSKLSKKLISWIKSKINQKISKMKADVKKKVTDESKNLTKRKQKQKQKHPDDDFENIDINDLAEI